MSNRNSRLGTLKANPYNSNVESREQTTGARDSNLSSIFYDRDGGQVIGPTFQDALGSPSLTNQYKVSLMLANSPNGDPNKSLDTWLSTSGIFNGTGQGAFRFDFLAHEAQLPGMRMEVQDVAGDRQGITERFATLRQYNDVKLSFYVSSDYQVLRLFQEWVGFMNPLYQDDGTFAQGSPGGYPSATESSGFHRLRYPNTYKKDIAITKFERGEGSRPLTYTLINAFPTEIDTVDLTYEAGMVVNTGITFSYDRYVITHGDAPTSSDKIQDTPQNISNPPQRKPQSRVTKAINQYLDFWGWNGQGKNTPSGF